MLSPTKNVVYYRTIVGGVWGKFIESFRAFIKNCVVTNTTLTAIKVFFKSILLWQFQNKMYPVFFKLHFLSLFLIRRASISAIWFGVQIPPYVSSVIIAPTSFVNLPDLSRYESTV